MKKVEGNGARIFGWCNDRHHEDHPTNPCRGAYVSTMGVRKGETIICECECHA